MKFGERLRSLRTEKKITQKQFASMFKIAESTVSMYERGEREPSYEQLERFASYFAVTTDYLVGRTDTPLPPQHSTSEWATSKDKRDIAKRLEEIRKDVASGDGLAFDGEPLSPEAQESFLDAMEYVLNTTKKINKKYTPKKYRKEEDQ